MERKETIIQVAQKLFAKFGLNKTTVDEIAKFAHIGKGTIYHYFKSKEDIFTEVIKKENRVLKEKLWEAIQKETSPQEKLRAFVTTRTRYLKELINYYSILKDDYLEHYSFVETQRERYFQNEINMVKSILDEGVNKRIFEIEDTRLTALTIVFALKGLEYPWTLENGSLDSERSVDLMLNILLKGIEKRNAELGT